MTPEVRIGDAEREAAVSALGDHYAAGRLTMEEYDERAEVAWSARTESALRPLFADLPPVRAGRPTRSAVPQRVSGGPRPSHGATGAWDWFPRLPFLPLVLLVVGLVLLTHVPWPLFLLVGLVWWSRAGRRCR